MGQTAMLISFFGHLKGHFTPLLRPRRNRHFERAATHDPLAQHANCGLYFGKSENGNDLAKLNALAKYIWQMNKINCFQRLSVIFTPMNFHFEVF